MKRKNYNQGGEIPLGLSLALSMNETALKNFMMMSATDRQNVINGTHSVHSSKEMKSYVENIANGNINLHGIDDSSFYQ